MKDVAPNEQDFESYLYIITHDLKTYSRAMRVIPEWIEEDLKVAGLSLPADVQEHVTMLQDYASGMDLMLDGLTELSRVGRLADAPMPIPLNAALAEAWDRIPNRDGFTLDLAGAEGIVKAPGNDFERLILALLSNTVVHNNTDRGHVTATGRIQGDRVILRIADDGPGIDPDYHEKVFQPLYTLRPKDESGTAGMGLAVARKVVTTLRGQIQMVPPPGGRGACVECDLPLA